MSLDAVLAQLVRVRGVGGAIVSSPDGLPVASSLREDVDGDALAAHIAEMISRSHQVSTRMELGRPHLIHVAGEEGGLLLMAAGPGYLAIITNPNANLALLQLEARPFAEAIARRLTI